MSSYPKHSDVNGEPSTTHLVTQGASGSSLQTTRVEAGNLELRETTSNSSLGQLLHARSSGRARQNAVSEGDHIALPVSGPASESSSVNPHRADIPRDSVDGIETITRKSSHLTSRSSSTAQGLPSRTGRPHFPDSAGLSRPNSHNDAQILMESLDSAPVESEAASSGPASAQSPPVPHSDVEDSGGSLEETPPRSHQRPSMFDRYGDDPRASELGSEPYRPASSASRSIIFRDYHEQVQRLSKHLPHLKQLLLDKCRDQAGGILRCYDIKARAQHPISLRQLAFSDWAGGNSASIEQLVNDEDDLDDHTRFFVVEDISPSLIEALGSAFKPNPEFFEEHLYRSGYSIALAQAPHPSKWGTANMPREYVSLRWYRPVIRAIKGIRLFSEHLRITPGSNQYNGPAYVEWEDTPNMVGSNKIKLTQEVQNMLKVETNVFRQGWPLTTNPDEIMEDSEIPVAWEERVTLLRHRSPNGRKPILLFLLDPLPKIKHTKITASRSSRSMFGARISNSGEPASRTEVKMLDPYRPIALRGPWNSPLDIGITKEMLLQLGNNLSHAQSTQKDMMSWLRSQTPPQNGHLDAVLALLRVVHQDIIVLLRVMNSALEEISMDSADDYRMQDRLYHWRQLMSQFEVELPDISESLEKFVRFVYGDEVPEPVQDLLDDCTTRIKEFFGQVRGAYGALRADMSVLESRRGISEAENVTKLTELAFVFIPLTFSASIFSMQIQELQNPVPLSSFIAAAVVVAALSYSVRLVIRSSLVVKAKRRAFEKARRYDNLPPGSRIPTRTFLSWAIYASRPVLIRSVFFFALCVTLVPIIFLWTHSTLEVLFKAAITLIFLPCGLVFSWYFSLQMIESQEDENEWFFALLYKLRQRRRRKKNHSEPVSFPPAHA